MKVLVAALMCLLVGSCATPTPTSVPSSAAATTVTAPATASPAAVSVNVRFAGTIHCASFPYGCSATLSVLEPGVIVTSAWRPPPSDPWWAPDWGQGTQVDHFAPALAAGLLPTLTPGRHQLVVSLLGSSDVPTYNPDGSRAFDFLGRCSTEIDVQPGETSIGVVVTFVPNAQDFSATCSLKPTL